MGTTDNQPYAIQHSLQNMNYITHPNILFQLYDYGFSMVHLYDIFSPRSTPLHALTAIFPRYSSILA